MLTNEATPAPAGALRGNRIGRRCAAGAVLLSLTTASLAITVLPAAAEPVAAPAATDSSVAGIAVEPVRVQAESYSSDNGGGLKKESGTDATGQSLENVGGTWDGGELVFDEVDLGDAQLSTLTVRYVNNSSRVGQNPKLEFYLDEKSDAGKLATVAMPVTGSNWNAYGTTTVELPAGVSGKHKLIVAMSVEADSSHPYVGNFDYFEFGPAELPETYLTTDDEWTYSDDATDPSGDGSLSWTTAGFDDSAWKQAAGSFGSKRGAADLGNGFVADTLLQYTKPGSSDTVETYHFRTDVEIPADELVQLEALEGTVTFDDAVRVYVNGEKVAGFEDQRVDEAPNQNLTYAGNSNGDPITETFSVPADVLRAGANTVSIALYQDRASSSDVYLDVTSLQPVTTAPEVPEGPSVATVSDVVLGVGATEAERNLAWYSDLDHAQTVQLAEAADVIDGVFPADAVTIEPTTTGGTSSGEFFRDATFSDLEENTQYAYRIGGEDTDWSPAYTFRTQEFSGDFSFLFFGDPQLGASGNLTRDRDGWADTLDVATSSYPDAELLFSAGDQVENAPNEAQYEALFSPEQTRSIPFVATNGNHDVGSKAYEQHFNLPNEDLTAGPGSGSSSGGDYWFIYKDVLFVNINSNSRDYASHNAFLEQVVAEQGANATWRVLAFHHSIYSVASHTDDGDIIDRRGTMPQTISQLGFDMVLMGHDHNYTRSYLIKDGELADAAEVAGQSTIEAKDGEVLYVTANSSSGSKYYDTKAPDAWFASVINQEKVRNYSVVEVTDGALTMRTLRSQANGSASPVNSVVDEVVLTKDAAPELTVPADSEIEVGDAFDALDGVTAIDNVDGDLTESIEVVGTVDTATAGAYTLDYSVSDARGNEATQQRTVTVVEPGTEEPGTEEPGTEEPGTEEPGTEEPGTEEPGTDEPGTDEPGTDEPGTEEPGTDEPGTDAPGTDERPTSTPAAPVADGDDLPAALQDAIRATIDGRVVTLSGLAADEWHHVYGYSAPTALGWVEASAAGTARVTLPDSMPAGTHRIAVSDVDGELIGWTEVTIASTSTAGLAATGLDGPTLWGSIAAGGLLLAAGGAILLARRNGIAAR